MTTEAQKSFAVLQLKNGRALRTHASYKTLMALMTTRGQEDGYGAAPYKTLACRKLNADRNFVIASPVLNLLWVSMTIEEMNALLRQSNSEVDESVDAMNSAYNKIKAMRDILVPDLHAMTGEIRQSRMATEREMKQTLDWMRTVREFLMEKDYEIEMSRLQRFVSLCKDVQSLKETGMLDAVADLAIKLAVAEEAKR